MTTARPRLDRDATTVAGYATLATFGWFIYTLGPTIPLLQAEQDTTRVTASLHSVAFATGVVLMGMVAVPVLRRTRRGGGVQLGVLGLALGTVVLVLGSLPGGGLVAVTIAGAFVAGLGGSLTVNAATAILTERHAGAGAAAVSEGNALASVVGLVGPLAVGLATALTWTWRAGMAVTIPLAAMVWLLIHRAGATPALRGTPPMDDHLSARLPAAFWMVWVALIGTVMVETGFITWTPDLLRNRLGVTPGTASTAVSAFLAGMASGRLALGRLALHIRTAPLFLASLVLALVGWALLWSSTWTPLALSGLVLAGLGAAGHFPLGAVLLVEASDGRPDRALARMAIGLGAASGAGPLVLGALADASTIHLAFLLIPACLAVAIAATLLGRQPA